MTAASLVFAALLNRRQYQSIPNMQYELPDGKMLDVGTERFLAPERLFNPQDFDVSPLHYCAIGLARAGPNSTLSPRFAQFKANEPEGAGKFSGMHALVASR